MKDHDLPWYLFKFHFNIILPPTPDSVSGLLPLRFPTTRATRHAYIILLEFIILAICDDSPKTSADRQENVDLYSHSPYAFMKWINLANDTVGVGLLLSTTRNILVPGILIISYTTTSFSRRTQACKMSD